VTTGQLTPNDVALQLAQLARDLDATVKALNEAERDAVEKRAAADLALSRAFLNATGAMDMRKHQSVVETHDKRLDADVAEAVVRHLRRRLDAIKVRIDVGRSLGAAIRAEIALGGTGYET
jgi:hypothetical protein